MLRIGFVCLWLMIHVVQAQNQLIIPPSLTGTTFNLNVQTGTQNFYGTNTPTFGVNGPILAPTLIVNKGDSITIHVQNNLPVKTTMHWHGLHVSAMNDGGPHQEIMPSTTWSPSFKVRNQAATFWYHPHGAGQTDLQVSKGIAGLFIVKDSAEALLNLPKTYGVDDIPLIVQTKSFDELSQIAIASNMDTALFVNGTLNPYWNAPAQVVRFRLLNGSSLRTFYFGFSNNQTFYQIGTDGGLKDSTLALTRIMLSPGERAEILVNFGNMSGQSLYLKSYGSEIPNGIYGSDSVGTAQDEIHDYANNYLNGSDFNLLQLNIIQANSNPITSIPSPLVPFQPIDISNVTKYRSIVMDTIRLLPIDVPNRAEGPFGLNNHTFNMDSIHEIVYLNTTEIWTLKNNTLIAHPFHIHDIQFQIIEKNGQQPNISERGWKDVVLVMPGDSVKFITKFETFTDNIVPYMYHCHLLHHEDDGMMGSFIVIDSSSVNRENFYKNSLNIFPNPVKKEFEIKFAENFEKSNYHLTILNELGQSILVKNVNYNQKVNIENLANGLYLIIVECNGQYYSKTIIIEN